MRAVIGWKSVLYESIEHRAELQLSRHRALATSCVLYNRTEHSQGFSYLLNNPWPNRSLTQYPFYPAEINK